MTAHVVHALTSATQVVFAVSYYNHVLPKNYAQTATS